MVATQHEIGARDRILAAAQALFAANGFHQTPIAELAAAAHVSVGQIYRLFKGKEDIINAIVEQDTQAKETLIRDLHSRLKVGEVDLQRTFELLLLDAMDNPHQALTFDILAEAHRTPHVRHMLAEMCDTVRRQLGEFACVANPSLTGETLESAQEVILAMLFGLGHRTLSDPKLGREQTARHAAQMIVAALRSIR